MNTNNMTPEKQQKLHFNFIFRFVFITILLATFSFSNLFGQATTTKNAGNWNSNGRWTSFPTSTSDVTIAHNISLDINTTINSLIVNSGSTLTINNTQTLTINGGITNNGTILFSGTGGIVLGGNLINNSTFTPGTGTITFNSNTAAQSITGTVSFYNLTISNTHASGVSINNTTGVSNNLTVNNSSKFMIGAQTLNAANISNSGTLEGGSGTINATGNFTNNGTFTAGTGTVVLNGTSAQSIGGTTNPTSFNNLTIGNSTGVTLNQNISINNALSFTTSASTLNVSSSTLTTNNLTIGGTLNITTGTIANTGNLTNNGTLSFSGSGSLNTTGNLVNNTGKTITAGSSTINLTGNFTNNGTFTPGTGTVTLNGTSAQLIGGATSPTNFYKLTLNNSIAAVKLASGFQANITNELTINSGATLDIEPGRFVNAQKITNNAGTAGLIIRANSDAAGGTLVFNNIFSEPVQGTVEFYSKAFYDANGPTGSKYKWQFFGIPLRSLATANPTFNGSFVRKYSESAISPTPTWSTLTNSSSLQSFTGYQITQAEAKTITFAGTLENSDKTIDITYTIGAVNPGQHVLANPYTAAIDIKQISFGAEMDSAVYFYNTGSRADWEQYSSSGSNPGQYLTVPRGTAGSGGLPGSIPSMQGFLVKTKGSNPSTISIPYSSVAVKNVEQLRVKSNNNEKIYSIINVNGSRFNDKMWLFSEPGKSRGYDNGWDGRKVFGSAVFPQIFAAEHDGNYQVNTVEDINNTLLGFRAGEDLSYTLTFNHSNTELKYQQITLTDLLTQQTVDITEDGSKYAFVHNPAFTGARFRINSTSINSEEDDTEDDTVTEVQPEKDFKVYYSSGNLIVNNPADVAGTVYLYDLKNQAVKVFNFGGKSVSHFPVQLPPGVYLAKASAGKLKHNLNFIIK